MRRISFLMLVGITSMLLVIGCVVSDNGYQPKPKPDAPAPIEISSASACLKTYASKASVVFKQANSKLDSDTSISEIHDFIKSELSKARSESFKGLDNRLQAVFGQETVDKAKGKILFEAISSEFEGASK